jgi:hypothetical protein
MELVDFITDQKVAPIKANFEKYESERNSSKAEQAEEAERVNWKGQFDSHAEAVVKELDLSGQFAPRILKAIKRDAAEAIMPLVLSDEWMALSPRMLWLRFGQQYRAALEAAAAEYRPLVSRPETKPAAPGTPISSRLPSAAPIAVPDPMMEKLRKGEVTMEEVTADFLEKEQARRSKG